MRRPAVWWSADEVTALAALLALTKRRARPPTAGFLAGTDKLDRLKLGGSGTLLARHEPGIVGRLTLTVP
jgi:hypothetical protein